MWPHSRRNSGYLFVACLVLLAGCLSAHAQTNASLHLKSGAILSGEVKTIGPASLSISLAGASGILTQKYEDITRIEWPEPDLWQEAMTAFAEGSTKTALELFTKLTTEPGSISFHPAPGNFVERSRRMMLRCHRRLRDGAAIAKLGRQIDWSKLPEEDRAIPPVLKVWGLVGSSDWPAAKAAADEAARIMTHDDPDLLELSFLRARIATKLGDFDAAISHYGYCYALPSSDATLAADAFRESAALLAAQPERKDELHALTHLYATMIGRGKLWPDAPAELEALLKQKLGELKGAAKTPTTPQTAAANSPEGGAFVNIAKFRFEPQPPGSPKPPPSPGKKPVTFETNGGVFKTIDAPADWEAAETRVGQFTSDKSQGTILRRLKEDPLLQLAKGKKLRLTVELHLGDLNAQDPTSGQPAAFVRVGLLNAEKTGYAIHLPLIAKDQGTWILADPKADDGLLSGASLVKLPAGDLANKVILGGRVLCEITLDFQDEGKVLVTARVDKVSGSATFDAASGHPIINDFNGGYFGIRIGKPKTSVLFDNVAIEVSP